MKTSRDGSALFAALLKFWRGRRGLSQLDLALEANVSARHVSFLETGRAQPSREMIVRLAKTLGLTLRDHNELLAAAGFGEAYATPEVGDLLAGPVAAALDLMLAHHDPYPMVVIDRGYDVVRLNGGATRLLAHIAPLGHGARPNVMHVLFDPRQARAAVVDWPHVARAILSRLHREVLERPQDKVLSALLRSLFDYPDVPSDWQRPDLALPSEPYLPLRLRLPEVELGFLTAITAFSAPQNVTLDELRIESYFPLDDVTREACAGL